MRLCADELIPGGLTLDDAKLIAQRLQATGQLDFFNLTLATFYNLYLVGGPMHMPLGYAVPLAAGIKEVSTLPVFATGRINDPAMAERVLADGQADMIGVVRGQIADPDFVAKAREGRTEEIRYCIACNQNCYGRVGLNKTIGCVQNPSVGCEATEGEHHLRPALRKKRVMVVGGGPAGMWAAKIATLRGHDVTLYERATSWAARCCWPPRAPAATSSACIARNERKQLAELEVPVEYGVEVTADFVLERQPDAVIVATGSRPKACPVGGADGPDVFNVWQVLGGEAELGEKVLLIDYDGHHQATATAEFLAELGKTVHVVTSSLFVGSELGPSQDLYLSRQRLLQKGVTFTPDFAVMEIAGTEVKGFNVYSNEWDTFTGYDSIVTAMGNDADDALYFALKGKVPDLVRVGRLRGAAPRRHGHPRGLHGGQARMRRRRGAQTELLVVVEPGLDPAAPGAAALGAEAARLAGALGRGPALPSPGRPSRPPALEAVADALAEARAGGAAGGGPAARHRRRPAARAHGRAPLRRRRRDGCSDVRRAGAAGVAGGDRAAHALVRQARSTAAGCSGRSTPRPAARPVVTLDLTGVERPRTDAAGVLAEPRGARPRRRRRAGRSATSRRSRPTRGPSTWSTRGASCRRRPAPRATSCSTPCASSPTSSRARSARRGR